MYRKLLNAVACYVRSVSATYPDVNLTLHVRVVQREKCGSNIVRVCAAPPACCTEPNASVFTHTHLHMDSSFIQGGSTPVKPFRSNHFCILEECKICGRHLFSILLVEKDRCVCAHAHVCGNKSVRERLPQSVN